MKENNTTVTFFYETTLGRCLLKLIQNIHADRLIVRFLRSSWSKPVIGWYARRHCISMSRDDISSFRSFQDFFARKKREFMIDTTPEHLISPCDGWLCVYPISENSLFFIKGSYYSVSDFLKNDCLAEQFNGGICMVFRLSATDYHHYCYIDDCYQGKNHFIAGQLHSVQPIACQKFPVYTLNRRCWSLITTEHFGPVVQTEIGALIVGGIVNNLENKRCRKGSEKGHFELAGSTIVLLFEPNRIHLRAELSDKAEEIRVEQGMWIATSMAE